MSTLDRSVEIGIRYNSLLLSVGHNQFGHMEVIDDGGEEVCVIFKGFRIDGQHPERSQRVLIIDTCNPSNSSPEYKYTPR